MAHPVLRRLAAVPPAYWVFALLLLTLWIARPNMLNPNVLGIFVRQVVPLGILVLGQLLVMRVRSIDLSGGGVILLINYIITFLIVAFSMFMVIKGMNQLKRKEAAAPAAPPAPTTEEKLLMEIRDLLAKRP